MTKGEIFKGTIIVGLVAVVIAIFVGFSSITEFIDNDEYAIHQSAIKGKLTVWNSPGLHWQWFGKVVTYKKQGDIYLSADALDGGNGDDVQAVRVQFPDGHADIDVVTRYQLSLNEDIQKSLYQQIGNEEAITRLMRQQILEAVGQVGPLMLSSDAYADRRPDIARLGREMTLIGIYAAGVTRDTTGYDKDKNPILIKQYGVLMENNKAVVTKESILADYAISFPVFNCKGMKFDSKTVALIEAKKDAKKAKQDAITAFENGQAKVATEKATQEVEKIKQVTIAEKEKDVAVLNATRKKEVAELAALEAKEKKKAKVLMAQAKKAELDIADGLSELAKYTIDKQTEATIESAKFYSKWVGPQIVVTGQGGGSGGSGLGDVLMLERYQAMLKNKSEIGVK